VPLQETEEAGIHFLAGEVISKSDDVYRRFLIKDMMAMIPRQVSENLNDRF